MESAATMAAPATSVGESTEFQWLRTGEEGLSQMLQEIKQARISVRLETYIFHADPLAEEYREALVQACQRGVNVWVLVDALGSISLPTAFWDPFVQAGGQFAWFNPIKYKRWSYRDHRKLMVVDERLAFVGGFNIAEEYKGDGVNYGWRDLGLRVTGPPVPLLARSFDKFFSQAQAKHGLLRRLGKAANDVFDGRNWKLILNGPGRRQGQLRRLLGKEISKAKSVRLISAYFLPAWRLRKELRRVCQRGGRVQIILAGKSDVLLSQLAGRRLYRMLMRSGVEIYEYEPQILHAKLFIFDDVVYVGSANLDVRSLRINYELVMRINDPQITAEAIEMFDKDLQYCRKIDPRTWRSARTLWSKLREDWAYFVLAKLDPYIARLQIRILGR